MTNKERNELLGEYAEFLLSSGRLFSESDRRKISVLTDALRSPDTEEEFIAMTPVGTEWIHTKSGGEYTISGHAKIESTWRMGVVYTDGELYIVRDAEEFLDGRFERVYTTKEKENQ